MRPLPLLVLLLTTAAWGADPDPSTLYSLTTDGSSTVMKAGQPGTFVLSIRPASGAHISADAPLKLVLSGSGGVQPGKSQLGRADAKSIAQGAGPADTRFEVPLSASAKGKGGVEAKLTFFVCTDTLCSRQQKTVSLPVTVN